MDKKHWIKQYRNYSYMLLYVAKAINTLFVNTNVEGHLEKIC